MKAKVTKRGGWSFEYNGKTVVAPFGSILNGDIAHECIADEAGEQTAFSAKVTPVSSYKKQTEKKKVAAAPENKGMK